MAVMGDALQSKFRKITPKNPAKYSKTNHLG